MGLVEQAGGWQGQALIFAGALAGGVVNGLTGFGSAQTALPVWMHSVAFSSAMSIDGSISMAISVPE